MRLSVMLQLFVGGVGFGWLAQHHGVTMDHWTYWFVTLPAAMFWGRCVCRRALRR